MSQIEARLIEWGANNADRDNLVRAAVAAGIHKSRVHDLTGIAWTTIDRIARAQ